MAYKRILVAVDACEASYLALQEALKVARASAAKLRIIFVADEFVGYMEGISLDHDNYVRAIKKDGAALLAKMQEVATQADVQSEIALIEVTDVPDQIPEKVIADAKNWKADLIVIGTHGRKGLNRLILGSVAEGLIRLAHVPVLLVRGKEGK